MSLPSRSEYGFAQPWEFPHVQSDPFRSRGYLVRVVFGHTPCVFVIPGLVKSRLWRFSYGVSVTDASLSDALERAQHAADRAA